MSLRGGMNDTDPAHLLPVDQCVLAENVEWWLSAVGERRGGCQAVDLTSASLTDEAAVVHLSEWFATNDPTISEWWGIAATPGVSTSVARRSGTTWGVVAPADAIDTNVPDIYTIQSQPLNGLLFWAYHSAQDRMHVWNGTVLRRAGLAQPAAPTAVDHGAGAYATTRYFRVRYTEQSGGVTIRRSEPSTALSFTPSGAGDGATITKPATISESETHWEVEASTDNVNFYRIATVVVGTTTYLDTTAFATGYSGLGPVSEAIGTYTLLPSARYIANDGDRLLLAGHWTDTTKRSRVMWTPVGKDPGVGNSERLPLQVNNYLDLDNYAGGGITGISGLSYGIWYAFKWSRIYQLSRTGDIAQAYVEKCISQTRGALPGSIVDGADEWGGSCVFFLDPRLGPSRIGQSGIQTIKGLRNVWRRVNRLATVPCHGKYYPDKQQVHWWIAVDGATTPNLKIVLQISETTSQGGNGGDATRGWALATGQIANALCSGILTERVFEGGILGLSNRPYVGMASPYFMQRCDVGDTDAGIAFEATIVTRPYLVTGLLNKWGAMCASLMAIAATSIGVTVRLIRNFGLETSDATVLDLSPTADETEVVKTLENLVMSGATSIQIQFSDT